MMKVIALLILVYVAGCGRHVVVEPSQVAGLNSPDWVVKSEPEDAKPEAAP